MNNKIKNIQNYEITANHFLPCIDIFILSRRRFEFILKQNRVTNNESETTSKICGLWTTHEYLMNPAGITKISMCDFTLLLHHYADDDLKSAGMPKAEFDRMLVDTSLSVMDKWNVIKPYWENSKNTAYNRVVLLTMKELFGFDKLDETAVEPLSVKIKEAYKTDWYKTIFEDKNKFDFIIADIGDRRKRAD